MVEKDLALCNTELNPFNNYLSNFWGSVQIERLVLLIHVLQDWETVNRWLH